MRPMEERCPDTDDAGSGAGRVPLPPPPCRVTPGRRTGAVASGGMTALNLLSWA